MKFATETSELPSKTAKVPLWLKIACTLFVSVLVPVYWINYGPSNFLWFSDFALLVTVLALWLECPFFTSVAVVGILLPELLWNIDFFLRLIFGANLIGLSYYMFDGGKPIFLRGLSLFHVFLPVLLLWLVNRLGYDKRALIVQTGVAWILFIVCYLFTDPAKDINLVFLPLQRSDLPASGIWFVLLLMIVYPAVFYLPVHVLLERTLGPKAEPLRPSEGTKYVNP